MAQLPTTRLDALFPPGLQAGADAEITLSGQDLQNVDRLLFSDDGLSAVPVAGAKFKVTASAGMAPALYEVRAAGPLGISASRIFSVGTLPELTESGSNSSPDNAQEITPPVTVNGTTGADTADYFRFTAAKGERLNLSCAAERIDSPLNAVLTVFDAAGHELDSAHRTHNSDAVMDFTAPCDGAYTVKLHDIVWQAGASLFYRLTVAPLDAMVPGPAAAVPLSGAVYDWMFPQPIIEIPETAVSAAAAHKVTVPCNITGAVGHGDWFEFSGEKDRVVAIDLLSHRHGQPTDWVLQVFKITRNEKGEEKSERVAEFDDTPGPAGAEGFMPGSSDPSGMITCSGNAVYRIQATDRFQARKPWQLVLRDPKPSFSAIAFSASPVTSNTSMHRWSTFLRRGGSALVEVAVLRHDGFKDPVALRIEGLPAGVSASEVIVPPGTAMGSMVLRAAADAKTWNGRIKIMASAGAATVTAREAIARWTAGNRAVERVGMRLSSDGFVLAVTDSETAPLTIEPRETKIYETALAGIIEVPVHLTRDPTNKGFKGEWEAMLMGMPGLRQAAVVKSGADAKEAKLVLDLKKKNGNVFTPGTWAFHASARGTIKRQTGEKEPVVEFMDAVYSSPIQVKIEPSPVRLTCPETVTIAPGGKAEIPLKLERRFGFAESVGIELSGPPGIEGLSAAKLVVAKDAAESKLILEAGTGTPPGTYSCTIAAKCSWNGEDLPWSIQLKVEVKP